MEITEFGDREIGELAALIRHYRKNGLWTGDGESSFVQGPSAGIVVKNTEAEIIPAYGCMEVIGTVEEDGRNYVRVKKPTSAGILFLFNGHTAIEASGYGTAQRGPVYHVYKNSGTVTLGDTWGPTAGQYYLTAGAGEYVVYGTDAIATNVFRVVQRSGSELDFSRATTQQYSGATTPVWTIAQGSQLTLSGSDLQVQPNTWVTWELAFNYNGTMAAGSRIDYNIQWSSTTALPVLLSTGPACTGRTFFAETFGANMAGFIALHEQLSFVNDGAVLTLPIPIVVCQYFTAGGIESALGNVIDKRFRVTAFKIK